MKPMSARQHISPLLGKSVRKLAQLRGGGSALPGLVIERIDPDFVRRSLAGLPLGVVLISGTNGKTTTTKMVVELLEGQGLKVFTNRTGSNFTRGVAAALLGDIDIRGNLHADIAVLELDEAYAVHFARVVPPQYSLFLNVMRDQLDRFGEIDTTASMLYQVARATTGYVCINRDDPRLASNEFRTGLSAKICSYGVNAELLKLFPSDDALRGTSRLPEPNAISDMDMELTSTEGQTATIGYDGLSQAVQLKLSGIYNILNAVGAVTICRAIMGSRLNEKKLWQSLSEVKPAFGRGEVITIDGQPCELILVKNPSGFRLSLQSFDPKDTATMIAINDNYADGRDMSWLWDVDFDSLQHEGVAMVSGIRAYDMALRLQYDEVEISTVEPGLKKALRVFLSANPDKPKRIFCTYTAMLKLRRELAGRTKVETIR